MHMHYMVLFEIQTIEVVMYQSGRYCWSARSISTCSGIALASESDCFWGGLQVLERAVACGTCLLAASDADSARLSLAGDALNDAELLVHRCVARTAGT